MSHMKKSTIQKNLKLTFSKDYWNTLKGHTIWNSGSKLQENSRVPDGHHVKQERDTQVSVRSKLVNSGQ